LAVFLPFDLSALLLQQLTGVLVSQDTIWNWVQAAGQKALQQLEQELDDLSNSKLPKQDLLNSTLEAMSLIIAAHGVTVPFRPQPKTPSGKAIWKEIKVELFTRLGKCTTKAGKRITRLHQRRFVAVLGNINSLKPRLQLEAHRQHINTATQVAWISYQIRLITHD
jgi:hypothetical protein